MFKILILAAIGILLYFIVSPLLFSPKPAPQSVTAQPITVSGTDFAFTPSTLTLQVNQPVTITFANNGNSPHNFVITDLNVKSSVIPSGQTTTVSFTPIQTGSFDYLCSVPGHADQGMVGTLTVE